MWVSNTRISIRSGNSRSATIRRKRIYFPLIARRPEPPRLLHINQTIGDISLIQTSGGALHFSQLIATVCNPKDRAGSDPFSHNDCAIFCELLGLRLGDRIALDLPTESVLGRVAPHSGMFMN